MLNPRNSYIGDTSLLPLLQKLVVHLTGTEDVPLDLIGSDKGIGVSLGEVSLEDGLAFHICEIGSGEWVSKEGFREEYNELSYQLMACSLEGAIKLTGFLNSRWF